ISVAQKYPDGRMDIVTEGRRRFEVMQLNQERSFLRAEVFYLEDGSDTASEPEIERALELQREIMALAGATPQKSSEIDPLQLSFHLAASLPLDLDFKQTLLGMKSEAQRLRAVISFFENILPTMRRTTYVRHKAGGNGHGG